MTEPLQVGQFAIIDHEPVDRGPNAGVFTGKGPADDRAELYIVAEGTTPAGESFAGHVVSGAGSSWQTLDMSLTGALRRVFIDSAASLRDWNNKSIAQHRVSLGITCFGRRGGQAVIAQAGPSIAFHRSADGHVDVYVTDEEHGQPLGVGADVEPQLTRIHFGTGDRLLLLSSAAANELDDEIIAGIMGLPSDQVLSNLYRRLQDLRHVTALLIANAGAVPSLEIEPARRDTVIGERPARERMIGDEQPEEGSFQPSLFIDDRDEDTVDAARRHLVAVSSRPVRSAVALPATITEIPAPLRKASGENILARLADERRTRANIMAAHAAAVRPAWRGGGALTAVADAPVEVRRASRPGRSFSRGLIREETPPPPPIHATTAPRVDELAEGARMRPALLGPVNEVIAGEATPTLTSAGALVHVRSQMPGRWRGGGALARPPVLSMEKLPPTWLIILVGVGVLMAVVGMITVPRVLNGDAGARYVELIDQANQKLATAGALKEDPAERRRALTEAQALLLEARDTSSSGPEADALLKEVGEALATMDAIRAPAGVETLGSLQEFGDKPVAITGMAATEGTVYLLEGASGQVISMATDTGKHAVVYSEDKDARRGRPTSIVFVNGADLGEPSLLIADSNRTLWAYSPAAGLRQVPLQALPDMQITDITMFGRDLYVLDAPAHALYRFGAGDGGYSGGQKVLDARELESAQRVGVDGEVLLSDASGTLRRFAGQLSLVMNEAGIDKRLVASATPQFISRNGDIALLDAPNDRIVVLRRDGAFDHQFRHKEFKGLSAFLLTNGGAYIFADGKLKRVSW